MPATAASAVAPVAPDPLGRAHPYLAARLGLLRAHSRLIPGLEDRLFRVIATVKSQRDVAAAYRRRGSPVDGVTAFASCQYGHPEWLDEDAPALPYALGAEVEIVPEVRGLRGAFERSRYVAFGVAAAALGLEPGALDFCGLVTRPVGQTEIALREALSRLYGAVASGAERGPAITVQVRVPRIVWLAEVQRWLQADGFAVPVSGLPDGSTDDALREWGDARGLKTPREAMHPYLLTRYADAHREELLHAVAR